MLDGIHAKVNNGELAIIIPKRKVSQTGCLRQPIRDASHLTAGHRANVSALFRIEGSPQ